MTPMLLGIGIVAGLVVFGWRIYQRCPHCGWPVRRVTQGWKRCPHCGRQYSRGLRVR